MEAVNFGLLPPTVISAPASHESVQQPFPLSRKTQAAKVAFANDVPTAAEFAVEPTFSIGRVRNDTRSSEDVFGCSGNKPFNKGPTSRFRQSVPGSRSKLMRQFKSVNRHIVSIADVHRLLDVQFRIGHATDRMVDFQFLRPRGLTLRFPLDPRLDRTRFSDGVGLKTNRAHQLPIQQVPSIKQKRRFMHGVINRFKIQRLEFVPFGHDGNGVS